MSRNNREIEVKLQLTGLSLEEVNAKVNHLLGPTVRKKLHGRSTDRYWPLIGQEGRGFVRSRMMDRDLNCLTVKVKDRDTNLNRKEIDIYTTDPYSKLVQFCRSLAGKEEGTVEKEYYVYWPTSENLPNYSVYQITGDAETVYIEIEAENEEELAHHEAILRRVFPRDLQVAPGSLYDIYVRGK